MVLLSTLGLGDFASYDLISISGPVKSKERGISATKAQVEKYSLKLTDSARLSRVPFNFSSHSIYFGDVNIKALAGTDESKLSMLWEMRNIVYYASIEKPNDAYWNNGHDLYVYVYPCPSAIRMHLIRNEGRGKVKLITRTGWMKNVRSDLKGSARSQEDHVLNFMYTTITSYRDGATQLSNSGGDVFFRPTEEEKRVATAVR